MFGNVKDSILQARMPSIVFIVIFAVNIKSICSLNINRWISDLIPCLSVEFTDMVYKKTALFCKPYISIKSARNSQTTFYILQRLIFIYFNTDFHPWYEIFFVLLRSKRGRCLSGTMSSKCAAHGMICFQANVGIYLRNYFNPLK